MVTNSNLNNKLNIVIVIPAYNEEKRIIDVLTKTLFFFKNILVVNDFSSDKTSQKAKECDVLVLDLEKNMGAGYATKIGCDYAFNNLNADIVVTIDADGQHAPEDIQAIIDKLINEKLDVVYGFRSKKHIAPLVKKLGNYLLSNLSFLLFNVKVTDTLTGFHAFTKNSFEKLKWKSDRYEFVSEFAYRIYKNKLNYGEVEVQAIYNDKIGGMKKRDGIRSIWYMLRWRFIFKNF